MRVQRLSIFGVAGVVAAAVVVAGCGGSSGTPRTSAGLKSDYVQFVTLIANGNASQACNRYVTPPAEAELRLLGGCVKAVAYALAVSGSRLNPTTATEGWAAAISGNTAVYRTRRETRGTAVYVGDHWEFGNVGASQSPGQETTGPASTSVTETTGAATTPGTTVPSGGTGSTFGGLFHSAGGGGGSGAAAARIEKALTTAQTRAREHPNDPAVWAAVGRAAYDVSQLPDHYVTNQGYTKDGFQTLAVLENAWKRYLAVLPSKPDATLAAEVTAAFGPAPTGIQRWAVAEAAQELVVESRPTYTEYANLAFFAYQAHDKGRGDLAASRAIALAPKGERKQLKAQLRVYKIQAGF
jgi:hypothetical protein